MDSLKSLLVAVSEVRAHCAHMCDVAQDLALDALYAPHARVHTYDAPIALADEELGYDFREIYMPGHPNADERGYVHSLEVAATVGEPSETQRSYEACLETVADMGPSDDMFDTDDDEAMPPLARTA
jgi:hypothetical protein